jgi:hypothetical protein
MPINRSKIDAIRTNFLTVQLYTTKTLPDCGAVHLTLSVEVLMSVAEEISSPLDTSFLFDSALVVFVVEVMQPVVDARTNTQINSIAFFSGMLI